MTDNFELELKQGFLEEAAQLLEEAEQFFLSLETSPGDKSVIESIFRLAHNFKGSSRAVGFGEMADFSHQFESLLLKVKNGEVETSTEIVNLLLLCNDHLKFTIGELRKSFDAKVDSTALLAQIADAMSGKLSAAAPAAVPDAVVEEQTPPAEEIPAVPDASAFQEEEAVVSELAPIDNVTPLPVRSEQKTDQKHEAKTEAKTENKAEANDEVIRVSLAKIEKLINNVGELVIMQTVLSQHRHQVQHELIKKTIQDVGKVTKEIQDISMSLRMISIKQTFQKMQRIVRDTSKILGKEVQFTTMGDETEIDKTVLESLSDPLVHLIRNAVDHGLESAEDRVKAGKPAVGQISLSAFYRGSHVVIEVRDDGRGLDSVRIRQKAIEKGVISENQTLSDKDCLFLIFAPGFSTKSEVSDISGRGVGLDVVKTNVEKTLHGEIQIDTTVGKGSTFRILLPLTLAIIDGMVVQSSDERFVVPLGHVHETLKPTREDVHFVTGLGQVLSLRGEELPLYPIGLLLGRRMKSRPAWESIAIVVRAGDRPFAILVDDIMGQQQVVVKRLGLDIRSIRGFGGGAILGDGRAALILDLVELVGRVAALGSISKEAVGWN